jgi:DNA invertase Pin-like site-specific DNA recombinase
MRACAYIRVSTELQGEDGYSLDHQDQLVRKTIQDRDWTLTTIFEEVASTAKPLAKRRQLKRCLNELDQGEHDVLVITRLDRLCRSSLDFADTLARADQHGWQLLCLDPAVDLTSPYGRALAGVAAVFAQLERELISQRTLLGVVRAGRRACVTVSAPGLNPLPTALAPVTFLFGSAYLALQQGSRARSTRERAEST